MYIFQKNMLCFINIQYNVNTCKYFKYILYVFVFIHNKYTQKQHIYYENKNFILDAINHLTALLSILLLLTKA